MMEILKSFIVGLGILIVTSLVVSLIFYISQFITFGMVAGTAGIVIICGLIVVLGNAARGKL